MMKWRWFHTFKDGALQYQGRVDVILPNGDLRVQLFSALTGEPNDYHVWKRDELPTFNMTFYESLDDMNEAFERICRREDARADLRDIDTRVPSCDTCDDLGWITVQFDGSTHSQPCPTCRPNKG